MSNGQHNQPRVSYDDKLGVWYCADLLLCEGCKKWRRELYAVLGGQHRCGYCLHRGSRLLRQIKK